MNHLTEEQLILHYYGEEADAAEAAELADAVAIEHHLDECPGCRNVYASLQRVLNIVDALPVPERPADYGAQVWQRISHRLPAHRRSFSLLPAPWRWAAAGAALAGLMVAAFLAGRSYPSMARRPAPQMANAGPADLQGSERVLRAAVGDYLERSQMVLVELANAEPKGALDISAEQQRAGDLVTETRLYRQTAEHTGDTRIASLLDELERVLVDIRNSPSQLSPGDLENFRQRLEADGILFKIRVLGSNVRDQEKPAAPASGHAL
jgi:hypothetical protein